MNAPIPIVDDDIDEAEEQEFVVTLNIIDAVDESSLNIGRNVTIGIIQDNDGKSGLKIAKHHVILAYTLQLFGLAFLGKSTPTLSHHLLSHSTM